MSRMMMQLGEGSGIKILCFGSSPLMSTAPNNARWKTNFQTSHMSFTDESRSEGPFLKDDDATKTIKRTFYPEKPTKFFHNELHIFKA